jgi:hypothetical protein
MNEETMKLRCMFAAHALAILADPNCSTSSSTVASAAWDVSDAMINEMKRKEGQWREEEIMSRTQVKIDVGEGCRQLDLDEPWIAGDECLMWPLDQEWKKLTCGGARVRELGYIVRRKVAP